MKHLRCVASKPALAQIKAPPGQFDPGELFERGGFLAAGLTALATIVVTVVDNKKAND